MTQGRLFNRLALVVAFTSCLLQTVNICGQTNLTILKHFSSLPAPAVPFGSLTVGSNNILYGTTVAGGVSTGGVVYAIEADGSNFRIVKDLASPTNGITPYGKLAWGTDGRLYGTTYAGGTSNLGTVFGVNTDGTGYAVLHNFTGTTDGQNPNAGLTEGTDGALYGTTYFANTSTRGTVFKINKNGSGYSILHAFTGKPDGQQIQCQLLQASDGMLYGTTIYGGAAVGGTLFKMNLDGTGYTILLNFGSPTANGYLPAGGVIEASDGYLYGVAGTGGGSGYSGVIYKTDKNGASYQVVYRFPTVSGNSQAAGAELLEGPNGELFGVLEFGSANEGGIYKVNKDGTGFTSLWTFSSTAGDANQPLFSLIRLNNGILYSVTPYGGLKGSGCIFALSDAPLPPRVQSLSIGNTSNSISFSSTSRVQYDVQRTTNLATWTSIATVTSPASGQTNFLDLTPPHPTAFYRLHQH